jgi:hypothetical protein
MFSRRTLSRVCVRKCQYFSNCIQIIDNLLNKYSRSQPIVRQIIEFPLMFRSTFLIFNEIMIRLATDLIDASSIYLSILNVGSIIHLVIRQAIIFENVIGKQ